MYRHNTANRIIGWSLGGFALLIYVLTTAPVVAFWDNGEFIAVGYTLGVGHPPGSPVYTLITRLFSLLPFPNVAQAVNFASLLAGALAIAFLYFAIARMARRWESNVRSFDEGLPTYITGVTACLFAAFSFSFWENSLEAEVYASNIFLMTFTLWLVMVWSQLKGLPRTRQHLYLLIYILSLGVGIHMGCLLWAPAFLLFVILFERDYLGVILLGVPLATGFAALSKGMIWGAVSLWILWAVTTVFYAVPRLWPQPRKRPGRKAKNAKPEHVATLPPGIVATLAAVLIILFAATIFTNGWPPAWFLLLYVAIALGSLFAFTKSLERGIVSRPEIPARTLLTIVFLAFLALSVHAYLLIRARLDPAINESDPHTWRLVIDVMRRAQYEPMRLFPRRAPFSTQFQLLWDYHRPQFTVWPLILALWGAIAHARKDRKTFAMMAVAFALASVGLLLYMNLSDHEVRSREYFWVPSYVGLAFWMGIASGSIVEWARRMGKWYRNIIAVALVACSLTPLLTHYRESDRSDNYIAYYYAWNILNFLEEDALLITNGDNDTFPVWYLQEVEGIRKDVNVVNLSLIQINWYIKQLKERGVPMSFTYEQIEQMHPYWARDPETNEYRMITLRDVAVHDIIRENAGERPVYFAVTVDNFMGYYERLALEGMVFKLMPQRPPMGVNVEKTYENCFENYRYDSIVDREDDWRVIDEVYKPPTSRRLITNYAAGFARLGYVAAQSDPPDVDEALRLYRLGLKFSPDYTPSLNGLVAIYAARLYQPELALPYAERLVELQPQNSDTWIRYAGVHLMLAEKLERKGQLDEAEGHYDEAIRTYERVLSANPQEPGIYPTLLRIYQNLGLDQEFDRVLELWQRYLPEEYRAALEAATPDVQSD